MRARLVRVLVTGACLQPVVAVAQQAESTAVVPTPSTQEPRVDPTPPTPRPPARRALVESEPRSAGSGQTLVLTVGGFESYDDDVYGDIVGESVGGADNIAGNRIGTLDPRFRTPGLYSGVNSGLTYLAQKQFRRSTLGVEGTGSGVYEGPRTGDRAIGQGRMSATASTRLRRWQLDGQGDASYSPYYQLVMVLPDQIRDAVDAGASREADFALFTQRILTTGVGGNATSILSRRSSFTASYSLTRIFFVTEHEQQIWQQAAGRFMHQFGKGFAMHLGYTYRVAQMDRNVAEPVVRAHDLDAGVDYSRALSFSRRTTLGISSGSTLAAINSHDADAGYRLVVTGNARIQHEIGRTWTATVGARRGIDFEAGFHDPFLTNTASVGFGGSPAGRIRLTAFGYFSGGRIGLQADAPTYTAANLNARVTLSLTRRLTTFGEYFRDRYDLEHAPAVPFGFGNRFDRGGVRVRATARLVQSLNAYVEYVHYRYLFDEGAAVPAGYPPSFLRQGGRIGVDWVQPLLGSRRVAAQ
jgi:hypothetical protein